MKIERNVKTKEEMEGGRRKTRKQLNRRLLIKYLHNYLSKIITNFNVFILVCSSFK